jgi:hypothetical protein
MECTLAWSENHDWAHQEHLVNESSLGGENCHCFALKVTSSRPMSQVGKNPQLIDL